MSALLFTRTTASADETEAVGAELAAQLRADALPPFIALYGDLGVGKTALTRGLASVLSPGSAVRSPTFALVNEYRSGQTPLFHFDMYRVEGEDDLESIGYWDYLDRGICVVEWSEKIPFALPDCYLRVTIEKLPENTDARKITVELVR
ncbi:MAG: tRNA (adenosine(37)-N6)-threonylcarbamoyltransferase complex ATPase subunit type 1 TsaE [Clostridia bacterium]|nr:tRNA (adenosine(37)-N6)-threonylcarbamoyltransferase complex ATPase subunit type 1 TsaE [Clostridia bacterium]